MAARYRSVGEAFSAFSLGTISEEEFIAACVALPPVKQIRPPTQLWDDSYIPEHGPLWDIEELARKEPAVENIYDRLVRDMITVGHHDA